MVAPAGLHKAGTARARQHHSSLDRRHTPAIRPGGGGGGCSGGGTRTTGRAAAPDGAGPDGGCLQSTGHSASLAPQGPEGHAARARLTGHHSSQPDTSGSRRLSEPAPSPLLLSPPRPPYVCLSRSLPECEQLLLLLALLRLLLALLKLLLLLLLLVLVLLLLLLLMLLLLVLLLLPRRAGSAHFRVQTGTTQTANDGPVMQALKWLERALPPRRLFLLSVAPGLLATGEGCGVPRSGEGGGFKAAFLGSDAIASLTPPHPTSPCDVIIWGRRPTSGGGCICLQLAGSSESKDHRTVGFQLEGTS
ncbi:uncharacterized protein LOC127539602 [Antechinus flavipes]|uniref:uncharacterized protein LOC127539602 n=1 Tax=Antechinus flavipes TaxID=38775 RepID=UPI0022357541|nr:uncharacterized protein LOC127539602 [Antechinus flavipes]